MLSELLIRRWNEFDDVAALTELLHRAYKPLADMGLRFLATHQNEATTLDRLSTGVGYVGEIEGKVIATITLYHHKSKHNAHWYDKPDVAVMGQLAVEPELQRQGIATKLICHVEEEAHKLGANELALDTAEGAHHLITYYEKLGYRFIEYTKWDVVNYRSVIMSKTLV
ncbi:MAG TPA: GNAT family N-acetyltransferase [Candidatus Kapabacteria bacterium]|nr:GNAT family N-acetyltransferase [Candidatus Kapabacteria bacterium]